MRIASVTSRLVRPTSRISLSAPRTTGMIPAWQASRLAWPAVTRSPVEVVACRSRLEQRLVVEDHHHRRGGPAVPGQAGGGDVLQQRDERLAALPGDRELGDVVRCGGRQAARTASPPCPRVAVEVVASGCGVGVEVGAQAAGGVVGDPGVQVRGPVAAAADGEPGRRRRAAFLGEQSPVVGFLGDVGGQVLQQPGPVDPQLRGSQGGGLLTIRVSALARRSSPRSAGRASRASVITRTWARFRSPAAKASATPVQRRSRASASAAWRRTVPGLSRVWVASQCAVDRSPVCSAMSSAAARTRSCRAEAVRVRASRGSRVVLLAGGQVDGVHSGDLVQGRVEGRDRGEERVVHET